VNEEGRGDTIGGYTVLIYLSKRTCEPSAFQAITKEKYFIFLQWTDRKKKPSDKLLYA